jgi:hypothetical protein
MECLSVLAYGLTSAHDARTLEFVYPARETVLLSFNAREAKVKSGFFCLAFISLAISPSLPSLRTRYGGALAKTRRLLISTFVHLFVYHKSYIMLIMVGTQKRER